jgi:hypothetical protein
MFVECTVRCLVVASRSELLHSARTVAAIHLAKSIAAAAHAVFAHGYNEIRVENNPFSAIICNKSPIPVLGRTPCLVYYLHNVTTGGVFSLTPFLYFAPTTLLSPT